MMLLPRRCQLALAAVVDIALHARPTPVTARAMAARHGWSPRHIEALLQELVRAGILKSARGPRGGYELARERRRLCMADIVRASMGHEDMGKENMGKEADRRAAPPSPSSPAAAGNATTSPRIEDTIRAALEEAGRDFAAKLEAITLEDLCQQGGGATPLTDGHDSHFTI